MGGGRELQLGQKKKGNGKSKTSEGGKGLSLKNWAEGEGSKAYEFDSKWARTRKIITATFPTDVNGKTYNEDILTINVTVVLGPNCTRFACCHLGAQKSLDFQGSQLPIARVMDFPPSKSLSPSAIYVKSRYIGNFMYMSFAFSCVGIGIMGGEGGRGGSDCHFRAPKVAIFRVHPFQWPLEMDLPRMGGGGGEGNEVFLLHTAHSPPSSSSLNCPLYRAIKKSSALRKVQRYASKPERYMYNILFRKQVVD
jgi:hypothetical protein